MAPHLFVCALSYVVFNLARPVSSLKPSQYCFNACNSVAYTIVFEGSANPCMNEHFYQTNFFCAAVHCTEAQINAAINEFNSSCDGLLPSFDSVVVPTDLRTIPSITYIEALSTASKPIPNAVIPDPAFFETAFDTVSAFYTAYNTGYFFAYGFYGFWGLVILIGILNRLIEAWRHRRPSTSSSFSGVWLWIRRSLVLPATFNRHCQEPIGWCTIPPRLESLMLFAYLILNFVACFPNYHTFLPNTYYSTSKLQLTRYISDRTGILAIANVPMFWMFATRNDPLLWITGWSFATYNRFHRWVARISTVQAIVHSIGWTVYELYEGKASYYAIWSERWWWTGVLAIIAMSLILVFAMYNLRRDHYDFFLVIHILLALAFLVGLYYHVIIFDGEFNPFIWPCVAIWSLDRLIRIARIAYGSIIPRVLKGVRATATYHKDSEMIRLDVTDLLPNTKIRPGIFYYLYVPAALKGYESHPFTLCSWRRPENSPFGSERQSLEHVKDDTTIEHTKSSLSSFGNAEICHSFLIRPYEGFTGRLRKQLASSLETESSCQITVLLEGPYGNSLDLSRYSDILVLAGGSGITAAISHTHHVLQSESVSVRIVWAVPQKHLVDDVSTHELAAVLGHPRVSMEVFLTGAAVVEPDAITPYAQYTVRLGRPDILSTMEEARSKCSKSLAIVSCGTPPMSDACRRAVVDLLKQDGPETGYFDESMTW